MIYRESRRQPACWKVQNATKRVAARPVGVARNGLTLAELLVATTVTTIVVAALGVFSKAVMDGCDQASKTGNATQACRVVTARIAQKVATSRQVLKMSDALMRMPRMDQVLIVWERDGEPGDTAPGQPNLVELVIYAPHKNSPRQLMELRPSVDPTLIASPDDAATLHAWIERFREGQDVVQPPTVVLTDLGGIHFEVDEFPEPQGIGGVIQQNVRIILCVSPAEQEAAVFFGSATRRYVTGQ